MAQSTAFAQSCPVWRLFGASGCRAGEEPGGSPPATTHSGPLTGPITAPSVGERDGQEQHAQEQERGDAEVRSEPPQVDGEEARSGQPERGEAGEPVAACPRQEPRGEEERG